MASREHEHLAPDAEETASKLRRMLSRALTGLLQRSILVVLFLLLGLPAHATTGYNGTSFDDDLESISVFNSGKASDEAFRWVVMKHASLLLSEEIELEESTEKPKGLINKLEESIEKLKGLKEKMEGLIGKLDEQLKINKEVDSNTKRIAVLYFLARSNEKLAQYKEKLAKLKEKLDQSKEKQDRDKEKLVHYKEKLVHYKEAKRNYLNLKLLIKEKDDPYLNEIDQRLDHVNSKIRSGNSYIKLSNLGDDKLFIAFYSLLAMLLIIMIFCYWDSLFFKSKKGNKLKAPIVPTSKDSSNKLISMERLRQLDGRVSKDTLDSSKKLIFKERKRLKELDGHAEDILEDQADINPYAKLIVEGHEMITRVNELAPLPLVIISWIKLKKLPDLLTHTLVGFIVSTVLAGVFVWTGKESVVVLVLWLLLGTLITLCLQGLKIMASATIHSLDEIICMMEPPFKDDDGHIHDPVRDLGNWIRHLFRSPWQYFAIIFFLFVIVTKLIVKSGGDITFLSVAESLGVSLVSLFFISPVIWLIFGSIITLNRLSEMRDLDINPLSPIKTMGLEKWISVIGVYNVTCSIVLTFGCSITIMLTVVKGSDNYDWFWFILIMPLLVFYWIYPHMKISRLVKSIKIERMQFLKTRISSIFNDWVKFEEGLIGKKTNAALIRKRIDYMEKMKPQMDNYYEVFSKIDESPHSYIDIYSTLELLKALGIPSLFALAAALLL